MRKFLSRLCTLGLVYVFASFFFSGTALAASSRVAHSVVPTYLTCHATGCYGHDPHGLDGYYCAPTSYQKTLLYNSSGGPAVGEVDNKYSQTCDANWVEVTLYGGLTGIQVSIKTTASNGQQEHQCEPSACGTFYYGSAWPAWTNMVDGTNLTYACWDPAYNSDGPNCAKGY